MARSETDQFITKILGEEKGWVSVAYKQGETIWNERQFEWPAERDKLKVWATKQAKTGDVFICPAVRIKKRRQKGDGKGLLWLWADVDMEKIPSKRHDLIQKRIAKLGTVIVSSGSGDNVHVYVRLQHEVTATEHEILNTGLRDYLGADNKQADNSLLRLPGTLNHKPANKGKAVQIKGGTRKSVDPEKLMALPAWQAVKIEGPGHVSGEWTKVDITNILKGGVKAHVRMRVEEAKARFGTRHKAVYAITQWLIKRGFSSDQIHSLMDEFPAAVQKNEDEHGGYDVHKDIARVMTQQPTADTITKEDDPDEGGEIPEDVAELIKRRRNHRLADEYEAQLTFKAPPTDSSGSLAHFQSRPKRERKYLIDGIAGAKHNVLLAGQFKTGKTLFCSNIVRCLADGTPFLDKFEVTRPDGRVGFWSAEMDPEELIDDYFRPQDVEHPENVEILHLQGERVNLISQVGKTWTIAWLQRHRVKVWVIDSLARLARMAGVDENDNGGMLDFFAAVEEIKKAAGVDSIFLIAHTGRTEMEEGKERARGATAIDDWTDARWILTAEKGTRMFSVPNGRGLSWVGEQASLHRDDETMRLSFGIAGYSKAQAHADQGIESVVEAVSVLTTQRGKERVSQPNLITLLKEWKVASSNQKRILELLKEAVESGRVLDETKAPGAPRSQGVFYRPMSNGARVVDFSKVQDRPRRKSKKTN